MSINTRFKAYLKRDWRSTFPQFKPWDARNQPHLAKTLCFVCDDFYADRGLYYFLIVQFSENEPGKFTVEVTVTGEADSPDKRSSGIALANERSIGTYRIARFWGGADYWWRLQRSMTSNIFAGLGMGDLADLAAQLAKTETNVWQPPDGDVSEGSVLMSALSDLNAKITDFVLPKLKIGASRRHAGESSKVPY